MDAVILAAGFGSRLPAVSESKPLTPIVGTPLLELGVRQAARAGMDRGVTLSIHMRMDHPLVDPDDATWVRTGAGGFIEAVGKQLADIYDITALPPQAGSMGYRA
jgi:CTP:molybdopterin cytidylyltransferase MocA